MYPNGSQLYQYFDRIEKKISDLYEILRNDDPEHQAVQYERDAEAMLNCLFVVDLMDWK